MDKLRFAALMARSYQKADWSDWYGRTARVISWISGADCAVGETIFDPLCRLKFEVSADQVSAAWMGARLHAREGSGKLGYIPGLNWTTVLCDGVVGLARDAGVEIRTSATVTALETSDRRVRSVIVDDYDAIDADVVVSAMPTDVLARLLPDDPRVPAIEYTALFSLVCGTRQDIPDDFYWLSLLSPQLTSSGIFLLSSLMPRLVFPGSAA